VALSIVLLSITPSAVALDAYALLIHYVQQCGIFEFKIFSLALSKGSAALEEGCSRLIPDARAVFD